MPSLPSFKMALATVSMRTPSSTKKCLPSGIDIAVAISLQQGSNEFVGSGNRASRWDIAPYRTWPQRHNHLKTPNLPDASDVAVRLSILGRGGVVFRRVVGAS